MAKSNVYKLDRVDGVGLVVDRDRVKLRSSSFMMFERRNMLCVLGMLGGMDFRYLMILCNYVVGEYNIIDCDIRFELGLGRSGYYRFIRLVCGLGLLDSFRVPTGRVHYVMNPYFCRSSSIINREVLLKFNENINYARS